jgi:hypothetical protein
MIGYGLGGFDCGTLRQEQNPCVLDAKGRNRFASSSRLPAKIGDCQL